MNEVALITHCLCSRRTDIRCDQSHCDLAGPGQPGNPNQCRTCWIRLGRPRTQHSEIQQPPPLTAKPTLGYGPGTELMKLMNSLGIKKKAGCGCAAKAEEMDRWGVAGCRQRREEIAGWLRENAKERGWMEKAKAAALATAQGIAFRLDLSDLYGSLVDLAIQRAEAPQSHS